MDKTPPALHLAMYPWFAIGHLTPFLHVANKLAKLGHKISYFIPTKTQPKLQSFNRFPDLITFVPITVPHVSGLQPGAETTLDVPYPLYPLIMTAMDRTEPDIKCLLCDLKPDIIFFDFTHWVPKLARSLGIKSLHFNIISPLTVGYTLSTTRKLIGEEVSSRCRDKNNILPRITNTITYKRETLDFYVVLSNYLRPWYFTIILILRNTNRSNYRVQSLSFIKFLSQ